MRTALVSAAFALAAFAYGVGVGRYQWPPWRALAAAFRSAPPHSAGAVDGRYQDAKADLYTRSAARPEIIMLGDSLTDMGIWSELLEGFSVANRGIVGDDSTGILKRLPEVLGRKPRVICLEIGTNDLHQNVPVARVIENVRTVADEARKSGIMTILQSVPFVAAGYKPDINPEVRQLNDELRGLADGAGVRFFDLNAIVADGGVLDARNTFDGVHLSARAYVLWSAALAPVLREALR